MPGLIEGVLDGVGFIQGVTGCMRSGVSGLFDSAQDGRFGENAWTETAFVDGLGIRAVPALQVRWYSCSVGKLELVKGEEGSGER